MQQPVTMKDIADSLGISTVSVSKALSGKKGVSEDTRKIILTQAEKLGYLKPVRSGRKNMIFSSIGIVVADRFFSECSFYASIYSRLLKNLSAEGFVGILEIVSSINENTCRIPYFVQNNKVSGIIVMGQMQPKYIEMISNCGIPFILLDSQDDTQRDCIISNGLHGSFCLTQYLIQLGHTRIGFLGNYHATSSIMNRYLGYHKALLLSDIPSNPAWIVNDRTYDGMLLEEFLLPDDMPTAFVCNCDEVAYILIRQLTEKGYRIPSDISVVGFDDSRFACLCRPTLTTFRVHIDEMCEITVARLIRKMHGKRYTKGLMTINGSMIVRHSAGSPRKFSKK